MQTLVLTEWAERGRGLGLPALVVHSIFGWVAVPKLWEFSLHTTVLAKTWLELAAVV